jgi:hypothetical protein
MATSQPAPTLVLTRSYYEQNARPQTLYVQGRQAGKAGAQGIVVLDFGRPAQFGSLDGTVDFSGKFISFTSISEGVKEYVKAYYRYAPSYTSLDLAVGTNDSCGPGQPCGTGACGCWDEPSDFTAWGAELAFAVEGLRSWAENVKSASGFTDDVRVVAGDDAEPAYDPEYSNTYDLLKGYAAAVGGTSPAMVDYGSADPSYWTEQQLFQVAYGFAPDVPMPEIYYPDEAEEWAALLQYAKTVRDKTVHIYGVLTGGRGMADPDKAYSALLRAVAKISGQASIPWLSTIFT